MIYKKVFYIPPKLMTYREKFVKAVCLYFKVFSDNSSEVPVVRSDGVFGWKISSTVPVSFLKATLLLQDDSEYVISDESAKEWIRRLTVRETEFLF